MSAVESPRPSVDNVQRTIAAVWALRGTCDRLRVGAVLARDGRTLASGYNGAPPRIDHCDHSCDCDGCGDPFNPGWHHRPECRSTATCTAAIHAEANVIAFAARNGVTTDGCTLYTTDSPCYTCAMLIVSAGIVRVVYTREFRDPRGLELLIAANVRCDKIEIPRINVEYFEPSGAST